MSLGFSWGTLKNNAYFAQMSSSNEYLDRRLISIASLMLRPILIYVMCCLDITPHIFPTLYKGSHYHSPIITEWNKSPKVISPYPGGWLGDPNPIALQHTQHGQLVLPKSVVSFHPVMRRSYHTGWNAWGGGRVLLRN